MSDAEEMEVTEEKKESVSEDQPETTPPKTEESPSPNDNNPEPSEAPPTPRSSVSAATSVQQKDQMKDETSNGDKDDKDGTNTEDKETIDMVAEDERGVVTCTEEEEEKMTVETTPPDNQESGDLTIATAAVETSPDKSVEEKPTEVGKDDEVITLEESVSVPPESQNNSLSSLHQLSAGSSVAVECSADLSLSETEENFKRKSFDHHLKQVLLSRVNSSISNSYGVCVCPYTGTNSTKQCSFSVTIFHLAQDCRFYLLLCIYFSNSSENYFCWKIVKVNAIWFNWFSHSLCHQEKSVCYSLYMFSISFLPERYFLFHG